MERIRTFIAITPPQEVKDQIGRIVEKLADINHTVQWGTPGREHITLVFLGDISPARMEAASKAVQETALNFPKFKLRTDTVSYFYKDEDKEKDGNNNDSVIILSIYDPEGYLKNLRSLLAKNLSQYEFFPSTHFSAHFTIGRLKRQNEPHEQKTILDEIAHVDIPIGNEFEVTKLNIYESISYGASRHYHLLRTFELLE